MLARAQVLSKVETRRLEDNQTLVTRACAGDELAFNAIFNRYSKPVLSFIYNLLNDHYKADELMQETFVRAYRNLSTMRPETQLSTWLFGIARNVVREAIKEKYREQRKVSLDEPVSLGLHDAAPLPDEQLITNQLQGAIQEALNGLGEDYRLVFVLKVLKEKSYEEIAEITGYSIGKLKTDLHRARAEMKRRIQPYLAS